MPKSHPPYPPEFRRRMVELVRSGRTPEELSREFEPSAQSISNWVRQEVSLLKRGGREVACRGVRKQDEGSTHPCNQLIRLCIPLRLPRFGGQVD